MNYTFNLYFKSIIFKDQKLHLNIVPTVVFSFTFIISLFLTKDFIAVEVIIYSLIISAIASNLTLFYLVKSYEKNVIRQHKIFICLVTCFFIIKVNILIFNSNLDIYTLFISKIISLTLYFSLLKFFNFFNFNDIYRTIEIIKKVKVL